MNISSLFIKYFFFSCCLLALTLPLVAPFTVGAQQLRSIVPCGQKFSSDPDERQLCTVCHLFRLLERMIAYLIYAMVSVAALFFAYGGLLMILPGLGGSHQQYAKGKKIITNALIGIAIIMMSWVLIDTALKAVNAYISSTPPAGGSQWGPWNQIECTAPVIPIPTETSTPPGPTHKECGGTQSAPQCVTVPGAGEDRCTRHENCGTNAVHNYCRPLSGGGEMCTQTSGEMPDRCPTVDQACAPQPDACADQTLAQKYGVPYPARDSPGLAGMMDCINHRAIFLGVPADLFCNHLQASCAISTIDKAHKKCNYTRGNTSDPCTSQCSHNLNQKGSCHYGGKAGAQGAEAVDYGYSRFGPYKQQLKDAAQWCGALPTRINDEGNHLHISVSSCDVPR